MEWGDRPFTWPEKLLFGLMVTAAGLVGTLITYILLFEFLLLGQ